MRVAVVGAGAMGLSIARSCANKGWSVVLLDQGRIPNPLSSGYDEHRLIRYPYGNQPGYTALVGAAFEAWGRLFAELDPDRPLYIETGTLSLGVSGQPWFEGSREALALNGVDFQVLSSSELRDRIPEMMIQSGEEGLYLPSGGVLLASRIEEALVERLGRDDVEILERTRCFGIERSGDVMRILSSGPSIKVDHVFLATGAWNHLDDYTPVDGTPSITASRQTVAYLKPGAGPMPLAPYPMILDLCNPSGLYVVPGVGGTRTKFGIHHHPEPGNPDDARNLTSMERSTLNAVWEMRFPGLAPEEVDEYRACYYALTEDGCLFLRHGDNVTSVGGGNGHAFKFLPVIGELASAVVSGEMPAAKAEQMIGGKAGAIYRR